MAALTLIQGDAHAEFEEHPTEIARRALMAAAEVEGPEWSSLASRFAAMLPRRGPRSRGGTDLAEEFLPVVIEDGREVGVRERVDICSTYEQAAEDAAERAARRKRSNPTARAAVLRRHVGPWKEVS